MSWIENYVRPRIQQLVRRTPTQSDLWRQCPACGQMIFHQDLDRAQMVCPNCGHHMRIGAKARFDLLFDADGHDVLTMPQTPADPLKFRDQKRYTDRLKDAVNKNGPGDALKAAAGRIDGMPAVVAVLDFAFMGGSMGAAVGAGFVASVRAAIERKAGFVAITASGGARMQEGILSLMQMPRTVAALGMLKDAGLPYIVVLTDPTTGGVSASFAMLGDIAIAEPGAGIGFAGQRVIKETIGQTLPEGFQRAEYLYDHGMIDMVVTRAEMKATLGRVLSLLMQPTRGVANLPALVADTAKADAAAPAQAGVALKPGGKASRARATEPKQPETKQAEATKAEPRT